mmetsp:Transcript_24348/g.67821  ORF Transcript_24348/g.67821 Transcript_24348/m.67821 type:complete len:86 (+) Transcript_24348:578-835(+)
MFANAQQHPQQQHTPPTHLKTPKNQTKTRNFCSYPNQQRDHPHVRVLELTPHPCTVLFLSPSLITTTTPSPSFKAGTKLEQCNII